MALFHSPFDLFSNIHDLGHMHRRRRRSPVHHHHHNNGGPFTSHHLDPLFRFLVDDGTYEDPMDTTTTNTKNNAEEVVLFQPEVVENDFGHLISARVPGVAAKDVVVNVTPDGVLTVRCATHPHVKADLRLPRDWKHAYNVAELAASCIDGVLLIAVPKMTPTSTAIVVSEPPVARNAAAAAAAAADDKMEEDDAQTQTIVLQVPGFSREDITVTRKRPAEQLLVIGKSSSRRRLVSGGAGGGESRVVFRREFKLSDPDAAVTATCADGLLTIRVVAPTIEPFSVPVSADRMLPAPPTSSAAAADTDTAAGAAKNNNDDDAAGKKITVMRRAVPGATASGFKVEVTFGGGREGNMVLTADADCTVAGLGRRRFHFVTSLPEGLDRSTLRANVVDGLLTVTAAAPAAPAPVAVHVSGDTPAALPLPHAPAPVAAATVTAAATTTTADDNAAAAADDDDMEADDR